ncbi:MAG: AhpC/TSA family protein [Bacteroidetes bacterium]|nr:AhpC/TSA family protein [Bacteroidota bacterium]
MVIVFWSCQDQPGSEISSVEGSFPQLAGDQITIEELEVRKTIAMDSAVIDKMGHFRFDFEIADAGFYVLKTTDDNLLLLQLEKGEHVKLSSNEDPFFRGYEVTGSPGSEYLRDFEYFMQSQRDRIDSIATVYYDARGQENFMEVKTRLDSVYDAIVDDHRHYIRDFVKAHPSSLTSLIVINRSLGQNNVLDEEKDFKLFHTIDSALMEKYPDNKHALDHHERVKEIQGRIFDRRIAEEKVMAGKKAPDIVLNDTAGNPFSLKSFTGHPTILQFWTGWSARSREDNQTLIKIYPDLQKRGFKILGVSLDENAVVWKGAVKIDQLPWKQVSSLQGLHSEIAKTYNLPSELPFYYLLDDKLVIRYKNSSLDSVLIHLDQLTLRH